MGQRGVYFALTSEDVAKLRAATTDQGVLSVVQDEIEERWDLEWLFQTDKAWDALHRCLTDGRLAYDNGEYPLSVCVLGGEELYAGDDDVVSFVSTEQVADVAGALEKLDESWLRERYLAIHEGDYGSPLSEEDFAYIRDDGFIGLAAFFRKAADDRRAMIFTVDL